MPDSAPAPFSQPPPLPCPRATMSYGTTRTRPLEARRREDLVLGLLAALAFRGRAQVDVARINERFGVIRGVLRNAAPGIAALAQDCYQDVVSREWDVVGSGVHAALAFGMAAWTGHDYRTLRLTLTTRAAHQLLEEWGPDRLVFEQAAALLIGAFSHSPDTP
jgi:hypothetical protein